MLKETVALWGGWSMLSLHFYSQRNSKTSCIHVRWMGKYTCTVFPWGCLNCPAVSRTYSSYSWMSVPLKDIPHFPPSALESPSLSLDLWVHAQDHAVWASLWLTPFSKGPQGPSLLLQMAESPSSSWPNDNIPFHIFFIRSSTDRHSGNFSVLITVNKAAVNIGADITSISCFHLLYMYI